ncbi:MAG: S8 family serine peptidase [Bacteroidota bacterium]
MKKTKLFLLGLITSFITTSQTIYKDYRDGELYVKYHINGQKKIGNVNPKNIPIEQMFGLNELASKYGIYKITRPFWAADDNADLQRIYKVYFTDISKVDAFINELNEKNYIEYAEKVPITKLFITPNDPSYGSQWHLPKINAPNAWNIYNGNSNITVAIVDNAIQITHTDLSANKWTNPGETAGNNIDDDGNGFIDDINGWDVADDDNNPNPPNTTFNHGTHCAGDAAARTNNSTGIAAIGWNLKIIAIKATRNAGNSGSIEAGYDGIIYAARVGAKVISCSWGGTGSATTEQTVINYAWNKGCIIVCAAGNDANSTPHYPAAYNNVFAVASTGSTDVKSSFSCYGTWVDISAPGENIYSTVPNNTYGYMSGTSMATPIVAGLCGLVWSKNPAMSPQAVLNCITTTAANIYTISGNSSYSGQLGAGRIDAYQALLCAQSSTNNPPVANFTSDKQVICPGQSIQFTDASYFSPTSWSWIFQGGTPATSTSSNPVVSWSAPGTYSVQLTATNANGSSVMTKTAYVTVSGVTALPLTEGFQGSTFPPSGWVNDDKFQDGIAWTKNTSVGGFGTSNASAYFDNYTGNARGVKDGLWTAKYDFSAVTSATIQFDVAYARYDATYSDTLEVLVSTNCGASWTSIYIKGGTTLATAPDYTANIFTPTSTQWRKESVVITPQVAGQGNVMFNFVNRGHWGQALYLDNINIQYVASAPPNAAFNGPTSVCSGVAVTFTDVSTNAPTSWNWLMPGATPSVSTVQNPTVTYYTGGVYSVTLTATNGSGSTSAVQTLTVKTTPTVSVNSATICSGQTATLAASGGTTYLWNTGAVTSTIAVSPTTTTNYTVTGKNGTCQDTKTTSVVVNPTPNITVNSATICNGQSAILNASGATSYSWNTGATSASVSVSPSSTTSYTVIGTNSSNCSSTKTTNVIVNPTPTITVNSATICNGQSAILNASGATSYSWNTGATSASVSVSPSSTTSYTVIGTNSSNCSSTKTTNVIVNPNPSANANVTNATSPGCANGSATITTTGGTAPYSYIWNPNVSTTSTANNLSGTTGGGATYSVTITDANNCSNTITFSVSCVTSIASLSNISGISIYPNPNNGHFVIESPTPLSLKIYNALGQLIFESNIFEEKNNIDISNYGKGIYNILLTDSINEIKTFRILIE